MLDLCFEIIEKCPNNCKFCSSNSCYDKQNIIDFDKFKEVIDYFMSYCGIKELSLSGGEPFLHPDLFKMISYAKAYGIRVVVFTSGIRNSLPISQVDRDYIINSCNEKINNIIEFECDNEFLKSCVLKFYDNFLKPRLFHSISKDDFNNLKNIGLDKVVFDFQAYEHETDEYIMGRNRDLHACFLSSLFNASFSGIETDVHFVPMKVNYKEFDDILEFLSLVGIKNISVLKFIPQGRGYTNHDVLELDEDEMFKFLKRLDKLKGLYPLNIRTSIPLMDDINHKCNAGLGKLVIKFDGTVLPCAAFKELNFDDMNKYGINYYNIYDNLHDIKVSCGTRVKPLCKSIYK